jgi:SRSO17 transposase
MDAMDAGVVEGWADRLDELMVSLAGCFSRSELRRRAGSYVRGLLGQVERKNGWQMAEYAGDASPFGVQRLLGRASWDADAVRGELVRYAMRHLLAEGEGGVLVVDETGFLKKGNKSCGVQRQYSGTAGRIENCQIGVFLALVGSRGRCLIDRELYLPKTWCDDNERRGVPYVLAVTSQQRLWVGLRQVRVDAIADGVAEEHWHRLRCGQGSKGPRLYDWAATRFGMPTDSGLHKWLLIRRSIEEPHERAYYLCAAPSGIGPAELAIAAGKRWGIESCFEAAKQETGLDEYEVRSWIGWYRHVTLSMLALAFLAAVRAEASKATEHAGNGKKGLVAWQR